MEQIVFGPDARHRPAPPGPQLVPLQLPIPLALRDVLGGDVFVVQRGLQSLGLFDRIVADTLERAGEVVSADARRALERNGLEHIHEVMSARDAFRLRYALNDHFSSMSVPLVKCFVQALERPPSDVYVCREMYVRMMMPEDVVATERELLAEEFGHMIVHAPHRDSWFSHCTNTINLWAAIGPVRPGNGMRLYPDVRDTEISRDGTTIDPFTRLGRPMNFHLDPGDILVFNGEHMHSSEVNITTDTRYVVTVRLTVGTPRYRNGIGWVPYHRLSMLDGPLHRLASTRSRLTASRLRHALRQRRVRRAARMGQGADA